MASPLPKGRSELCYLAKLIRSRFMRKKITKLTGDILKFAVLKCDGHEYQWP